MQGNGGRLLRSTKPLALTNIAFGLLLNMIPCFIDAGVAEWVDAVDLKSAEPLARAGSTPALGIESRMTTKTQRHEDRLAESLLRGGTD